MEDLPPYTTFGVSTIPSLLPTSDTVVKYQPVPMNMNNHHQVLKAISASNKSVASLTNILGTYLKSKLAKEVWRKPDGFPLQFRDSPQVLRKYIYVMHKLETLSGKVLNHHQDIQSEWMATLGPFRREIFAVLHNDNNVVRCFAKEIPESPLMLPKLDEYALGLRRGQYWHHRSARAIGDPMSLLSKVRTVILLCDNISMNQSGHGRSGSAPIVTQTGWSQAQRLLGEVAVQVSKYNLHGIDIHFLNQPSFYSGILAAHGVNEIFNTVHPCSVAYSIVGHRVSDILEGYISTLRYYRELMPLNLLVITDGSINDDTKVLRDISITLSNMGFLLINWVSHLFRSRRKTTARLQGLKW